MAGGSTIGSTDRALSLLGAGNRRTSQVLDAGQEAFAVTALDTLTLLVHTLRFEDATGGTYRPNLVLGGIVRVSRALSGPTRVRHCE